MLGFLHIKVKIIIVFNGAKSEYKSALQDLQCNAANISPVKSQKTKTSGHPWMKMN